MAKKNPKVDEYIANLTNWQTETKKLRKILLDCGLAEDLKWRQPCYSFNGSNVVIIQGFKNEIRLMFFKGALLKDKKKVLEEQGQNTQSARVIKFKNSKEISNLEKTIKAYVEEAMDNEDAGLKVEFKKTKDFDVPEELQSALKKNAKLKKAFEALTPGRQRAYLIHFSSAKQSSTRVSRIEKSVPAILAGKGPNER